MFRIKQNKEMLFAPVITLCILLVIFIVKGVYPFGDASISYFDMNQSFIPIFTRVHDVLHGDTSFFYDWYAGASNRTYVMAATYALNPVNLFFYFVPRDKILESMTLFLTLKMMAMSFTMALYMTRSRKLDPVYTVTLSVLYAFCGYLLQYYTNIPFLDSMLLFPLVIIGLLELLRNDKGWIYTLLLAIHLIVHTYLSIMVLIFIVFYSAGYLLLLGKRENRCRIAARLGICTLIALAVSSVLIYPEILQWSLSVRTSDYTSDYFDIIYTFPISAFDMKMFMMFGSEFALSALVIIIVKAVIDKKNPDREVWFYIFLMVLLCIPVFVESVNLLWHMGSYVEFPFRFAFILTFVMLDFLALFLERQPDTPYFRLPSGYNAMISILIFLITIIGLFSLITMASTFLQYGIHGNTGFYTQYYTFFLLSIIAGTIVLAMKNKRFRKYYFLTAAVLQSAAAGWGFIAPAEIFNGNYELTGVCSPKSVYDSNTLDQQMEFRNDNLSRVKQVYSVLSTNYPLIMARPSLSQWLNESSAAYIEQMDRMGYTMNFTRTVDAGGTIFSDALLNVKKVISTTGLDSRLYTQEQQIAEYNIYDCNYKLPFGILTDERILESDFEETGMALQNQIFSVFSQTEAPLIRVMDVKEHIVLQEETPLEGGQIQYKMVLELPAETESVLYVFQNTEYPVALSRKQLELNGQIFTTPLFDIPTHPYYPEEFSNGMLNLGYFDSGTVELATIASAEPFADEDGNVNLFGVIRTALAMGTIEFEVGFLDLNELEKLTDYYSTSCVSEAAAQGNKLTMTADVQENEYLFLPIEYDKNWQADVNGSPAEVYPVLNGSFMAVHLPEGHCDIRMKYVPSEMIAMIPAAAGGILIAAALLFFRRKGHDLAAVKAVNRIAYACLVILTSGMLLIIYIIPVVTAIKRLF